MIDPKGFLAVANTCMKVGDEAHLRTAISRAYYALFLECQKTLENWGICVRKTDNSHVAVYRCLNNCGEEDMQALAGVLNQLREHRRIADYDLSVNVDRCHAEKGVMEGKVLLGDFRRIVSDPEAGKHVRKGARDYARGTLRLNVT